MPNLACQGQVLTPDDYAELRETTKIIPNQLGNAGVGGQLLQLKVAEIPTLLRLSEMGGCEGRGSVKTAGLLITFQGPSEEVSKQSSSAGPLAAGTTVASALSHA